MISLYTSFFNHHDPFRMNDFYDCLVKNINNILLDKIYLFIDDEIKIENQKITTIYIKNRPTYSLVFDYFSDDSINILSNTDIYFDHTIEFCKNISRDKCYALSRYEEGKLFNRADSQDVWIFNGMPRNIYGEFLIGIPGCDNRIAYEINKANYKITNPSNIIKAHHTHTGIRDYKGLRVNEPYLHIPPSDEL